MSDLNMNNISWWKQLRVLTNRSFVNMTRDLGYYWLRILFLVLIAFSAGMMFFDISTSSLSIIDRAKFYTYFFDLFLCLCVGGIPSFFEEWKVKILLAKYTICYNTLSFLHTNKLICAALNYFVPPM